MPTTQDEQNDVIDIFLNKLDEENAPPQQQACDDQTNEEIEVKEPNPSPSKPMQVDPSCPSKKDDKTEGEQSSPPEKSTPVTPSGAHTDGC